LLKCKVIDANVSTVNLMRQSR